MAGAKIEVRLDEKDLHWTERSTTGRLPWGLNNATASSEEWIVDADGGVLGTVFFIHDRDRRAFLDTFGMRAENK